MTTDLRKTADKNRDYYLAEQKADNGENKWFRYIKTMDSYAEPILITPEMAREVLESSKEAFDLRKASEPKVIIEDNPTISFSFSGKLLSGRAVLEAIAISKKSTIVFISFNVSDKLSFLFDQH